MDLTELRVLQRRFLLWLAHNFFSYMNVPTESVLWHRRGQILIVVSSLLMVVSWLNFFWTLSRAFDITLPMLAERQIYVLVALGQLALMFVPIWLVHRGSVRLGAVWLLTLCTIGLIKYGVARDFQMFDQLTMMVLMIMILLAGALLGGRAGVGMAIIVSLLETALILLLDRGLSPEIRTSSYWINGTMGVLVWGVMSTFDKALLEADLLEQQREAAKAGQAQEAVELLQYVLTQYAHEEYDQPVNTAMTRLTAIENRDWQRLAPESQADLLESRQALLTMVRAWERILEISPLGVMPVALKPIRYPLRLLLLKLEQEYLRHSLASTPLAVSVDDRVPEYIVGSPSITRRILLDALACMIERTGCPVAIYVEAPAADQVCIRLTSQQRPGSMRGPLPPMASLVGSGRDLVGIRAMVEAVQGTMTFIGTQHMPQTIIITLPVEMQGQADEAISIAA